MADGWRTLIVDKHLRMELMNDCIVLNDKEEKHSFPIGQLRDIMLSYPAGSITLPLLEKLAEERINLTVCDKRRTPIAQFIPLNQHTESAGHIMDQAQWTKKRKELAWKHIARNKIAMQEQLTRSLRHPFAEKLAEYAKGVRLGDKTNREGQAARLYFTALFGNDFIRHAPDDINAALNYGYTILNTAMSRILSSHGYSTALGIHHCGRTNPVNLSCDLMEPFRPLVDEIVLRYGSRELDWPYKQELIGVLQSRCVLDGKEQKTEYAMELFALQMTDMMQGKHVKPGVISFAR